MNTSKLVLSSEQTGGPLIYRQNHSEYLAIEGDKIRIFHIAHLAAALGDRWRAGVAPQEHASLILLACCGRGLFWWLDTKRTIERAKEGTGTCRAEMPKAIGAKI